MEVVTDTLSALGSGAASLGGAAGEAVMEGLDNVVTLLSPDSLIQLVLVLLGLALLTYLLLCLVYHAVRGLYTFTLPWLLSLVTKPRMAEKYGPWAVVTGSTQVIITQHLQVRSDNLPS